MDEEILDVLIEWIFGHRRGLLKQVDADDKAIEKLQTLKEEVGTKPLSPEMQKYYKTGDASGIIKEADKPE